MALPKAIKADITRILEKYCNEKIPAEFKNEIQLNYEFYGLSVFLIENRYIKYKDKWVNMKIAKFKFDLKSGTWALFCSDRNDRWHPYQETGNESDFQILLEAVEKDVTGIFWG